MRSALRASHNYSS